MLEIADGACRFGEGAMGGLERQGVPVSVGDEGVITVDGKQRQLEP